MRKLYTLTFFTILGLGPAGLFGQCSITSLVYNFCNCTNGGNGTLTNSISIDINGNSNNFMVPATCNGNAVTMGNVNIDINNDAITIPATVRITGPITFDANGNNRIVTAGGVSYTSTASGSPNLTDLENEILACLASPPPGGCTFANFLLPVELTRFEAKSKNDMVELAWETASELNNDYFQIEYSRDGIQFTTVGQVKGEGTTAEIVDYSFVHRQPIVGTNYYRLKQVDYDGAFEYSDVVVVELGSRVGGVQIYPNPTINKAAIVIGERPERVVFSLSNLLGQRMDLQPVASDIGWELDLSNLTKGIYVLNMAYDGKTVIKRIVKQ